MPGKVLRFSPRFRLAEPVLRLAQVLAQRAGMPVEKLLETLVLATAEMDDAEATGPLKSTVPFEAMLRSESPVPFGGKRPGEPTAPPAPASAPGPARRPAKVVPLFARASDARNELRQRAGNDVLRERAAAAVRQSITAREAARAAAVAAASARHTAARALAACREVGRARRRQRLIQVETR